MSSIRRDSAEDEPHLTPQQRMFVQEYLVDHNATQAAIRAGYSRKTAYAQGSRLLRHAEVSQAIAEGTARIMAKLAISQERVVEELARIAFSDIRSVLTWSAEGVSIVGSEGLAADAAAAVAEIAATREGVRVRMHDKIKALTTLGLHLGMFAQRHEFGGDAENPLVALIHSIDR